MKAERTRFLSGVTLAVLTFPLIEVGTCLSIAKESVAAGFVDTVTPRIVERAEPYVERAAAGAANLGLFVMSDSSEEP